MEINQTLIFGHKNPDTDSIMSSMVMANLENQLGNEAIPVRLGKINKETEYVFNYLQIERPEEISDIEDGQNVILVDHNESTQSANNISNANILKVIDHHTMNFVAPYQLYYRAEPVGCTATVLYKMYKEYDVEITKTIATLMLSAIISDTLLLKSPTCTKEDKVIVEGVNMVKKHLKPTQQNPEGGIVEKEAKIHVSNVMLYDEKAKVASRVRNEIRDGKKVRVYVKSGNVVK